MPRPFPSKYFPSYYISVVLSLSLTYLFYWKSRRIHNRNISAKVIKHYVYKVAQKFFGTRGSMINRGSQALFAAVCIACKYLIRPTSLYVTPQVSHSFRVCVSRPICHGYCETRSEAEETVKYRTWLPILKGAFFSSALSWSWRDYGLFLRLWHLWRK
jgi:hypothetical protein